MTDTKTAGYACRTCGTTFPSVHALGGHMSAAHRPLVECSVCGRKLREGVGVTQHMKKMHSIQSETVRKKRQHRKSLPRDGVCPVCQTAMAKVYVARHMRFSHNVYGGLRRYNKQQPTGALVERAVPERQHQPPQELEREPLTAEQIVRTACAWFWPEGVPLGRMEAVLLWHTHTTAFLEQATTNGER
jgi:hypothetical protein